MGSGFAQGVEPLPCPFLTGFHGPGPIDRGAWLFRCLFGVGGKPSGGGRRRVGYAHPPAAGQARQRACSGAGAFGPGPRTPPPPAWPPPSFLLPQAIALVPAEKRWRRGRMGAVGVRGGGGGVLRPGPQNGKRGAGGKAFGSPFFRALRAPAAPLRPLEVSPSFQMERLFLRPKTYAQN